MECKFNINSYKIVYVAGTEDLMYRKRGMQRAYKVGTILSYFVMLSFGK